MKKIILNILKDKTIYILFALLFVFYWFEIRPINITKLCIQSAQDYVYKNDGDQTDMRYWFWKCEKQHGFNE